MPFNFLFFLGGLVEVLQMQLAVCNVAGAIKQNEKALT